jgi:hypothetical protein
MKTNTEVAKLCGLFNGLLVRGEFELVGFLLRRMLVLPIDPAAELVATLRYTYAGRMHYRDDWNAALLRVRSELCRRGEDTAKLLRGLRIEEEGGADQRQ